MAKKDLVPQFADFKFGNQGSQSQPEPKQEAKQEQQPQQPQQNAQSSPSSGSSSYPKHQKLNMPALSPTMTEGKIVKWNIKEGDSYSEGDSLVDIETDKATVAFEATDSGVLAKIIAKEGSQLQVGDALGISVKNKGDV